MQAKAHKAHSIKNYSHINFHDTGEIPERIPTECVDDVGKVCWKNRHPRYEVAQIHYNTATELASEQQLYANYQVTTCGVIIMTIIKGQFIRRGNMQLLK